MWVAQVHRPSTFPEGRLTLQTSRAKHSRSYVECPYHVTLIDKLSKHFKYLCLEVFFTKYNFFFNGSSAQSGPWPLIEFRNHFSQKVGLLGWVISPSQGLYRNTGQHKHRINAHTHHTSHIHALSGIRTHDPSVRASEDSSCLRQRGYRDRLASERAKTVHALDCAAAVTGPQNIIRVIKWRRWDGECISHAWKEGEVYTEFYSENRKQRNWSVRRKWNNTLIMLKCEDVETPPPRGGVFWVAERILAFQERFCSVDLLKAYEGVILIT
jgi:hypothetical protein